MRLNDAGPWTGASDWTRNFRASAWCSNGLLAERVPGLGLLAMVNPHAQVAHPPARPARADLHAGTAARGSGRSSASPGRCAKLPGLGRAAAKRRVVAARLAQTERGRRWNPVLLLDSWRREAELVVGDVDRMLADTAPGPPRSIAVPPTATEVLARMRLPRRAAVRRKGVERREVLAAVIAAYPDNLRSLKQAQEMCDQVLTAGFTALSGSSGTSWIDTDRYRVPPALVTTSRQPVGWRDPRTPDVPIPDSTVTRTRKLDQAQQLLPLQLPAPPPTPPRRRPVPLPRPDLDRVDQVELDLGLDPGSADTPVDPFGEQLTIDVADGPPIHERHHGMTSHRALAAQCAAAEADLQRAEAAAAAHDQQTRLLLAAVLEGRGEAATALRRRRLCLDAVAAMSAHANALLEQAREDRTEAAKERKLAARLRELAGRLWMSEDGKLEAAGLIREDQGDGKDAGDSGERPVSRKEVTGHAKRLEGQRRRTGGGGGQPPGRGPRAAAAGGGTGGHRARDGGGRRTRGALHRPADPGPGRGRRRGRYGEYRPAAPARHGPAPRGGRRGARRGGGVARGAGVAGADAGRSARPGGGDPRGGAVQGARGEAGRCGQACGTARPAGAWAAGPEPWRRGALNRSVRTATVRTRAWCGAVGAHPGHAHCTAGAHRWCGNPRYAR